jgi:hypothetical protein
MTVLKEQYVRFPRKLLESPALRVLTANEYRAFIRILIEHQRHSGFVKDGLPVTKKDFVSFGIHPRYVASSLRVLEALGLIECTRRTKGTSSGRLSNLWRPTFLPTTPKANNATHDYTKFTTTTEAHAAAEAARVHDTRKRYCRVAAAQKERIQVRPARL